MKIKICVLKVDENAPQIMWLISNSLPNVQSFIDLNVPTLSRINYGKDHNWSTCFYRYYL